MANQQPAINPFNDSHYDLMCQAARSCAELKDYLERLQRAGFDVGPQIGENNNQYDMFTGLKKEFFPDRP